MTSFFKHNKLLHNFSVGVQKIGAFVKALVLGFFSTRAEPFSRENIAKIIKKIVSISEPS